MDLPLIFNIPRQMSYLSNHHSHKVGAAIFIQGKLISKGFNNNKTHPKMIRYGGVRGHHAEYSAIVKIKNKSLLRGATLVVYRENKSGNIAMSRCCELCMSIVKEYGIKKIIYTTDNGYFEEYL